MEKFNGKLKNMFIISQIAMVTEFEKKTVKNVGIIKKFCCIFVRLRI